MQYINGTTKWLSGWQFIKNTGFEHHKGQITLFWADSVLFFVYLGAAILFPPHKAYI